MASENALTELAESMKRKVADFSGDETFMSSLKDASSPEERKAVEFFREYALASRIVAELAKVESLYEKMNAKARNGHIVEAEELAHELHLAKESMFENFRAIAEEGAGNGK